MTRRDYIAIAEALTLAAGATLFVAGRAWVVGKVVEWWFNLK